MKKGGIAIRGKDKMVIFEMEDDNYRLEFRGRRGLRAFMRFLKDNDYDFFIRDEKGRINPIEVEIKEGLSALSRCAG